MEQSLIHRRVRIVFLYVLFISFFFFLKSYFIRKYRFLLDFCDCFLLNGVYFKKNTVSFRLFFTEMCVFDYYRHVIVLITFWNTYIAFNDLKLNSVNCVYGYKSSSILLRIMQEINKQVLQKNGFFLLYFFGTFVFTDRGVNIINIKISNTSSFFFG